MSDTQTSTQSDITVYYVNTRYRYLIKMGIEVSVFRSDNDILKHGSRTKEWIGPIFDLVEALARAHEILEAHLIYETSGGLDTTEDRSRIEGFWAKYSSREVLAAQGYREHRTLKTTPTPLQGTCEHRSAEGRICEAPGRRPGVSEGFAVSCRTHEGLQPDPKVRELVEKPPA